MLFNLFKMLQKVVIPELHASVNRAEALFKSQMYIQVEREALECDC